MTFENVNLKNKNLIKISTFNCFYFSIKSNNEGVMTFLTQIRCFGLALVIINHTEIDSYQFIINLKKRF